MRIRGYISMGLLLMGALVLVLGALLLKAAYNTGANDNYNVRVTWGSAFGSVFWPPWKIPLHYILIALVPVAIAWVSIFHLPRFIGTPLLWFQTLLCWNWHQAGNLGAYFLVREFEHYKFEMDGERLGETWFTYEAVAIWMLITAFLGFLRLTFRSARVPPVIQVAQPAQ